MRDRRILRHVIVVGQAPSRETDGLPPFSGRSGARLARLMGVDELAIAADNLIARWPGPSPHGKGDAFPLELAREGAARVARRIRREGHGRVLLAGQAVARVYGYRAPFLEWRPCDVLVGDRVVARPLVAVIPHPSGVSRWWNDPANHAAAEGFLRALAA